MAWSSAVPLGVVIPFLATMQDGSAPGQCGVLGLCGLLKPERPVASGLLFVAVGMVALGVWGLRRRRER